MDTEQVKESVRVNGASVLREKCKGFLPLGQSKLSVTVRIMRYPQSWGSAVLFFVEGISLSADHQTSFIIVVFYNRKAQQKWCLHFTLKILNPKTILNCTLSEGQEAYYY